MMFNISLTMSTSNNPSFQKVKMILFPGFTVAYFPAEQLVCEINTFLVVRIRNGAEDD